jgi:D-3-phosphoglycerate dehydrogenase
MKKVLIPTKLEGVAKDILVKKGYTVVQDADTPLTELMKAHPDAEALIVRSEKVNAAVIDALPKLKLVVRAGAGFDTIDIKHARKKKVDVMNTPGANANAVAEEVLAMVLANYRFIVDADNTTRQGLWEKKKYMGRELTGKTVGIVGLGNIGRLVAKRLSGFENRMLGYDPVLSAARAAELGIEMATLEKIFAESDIITVHVPGSAETNNLIGAALLKLMKKGAVLVNCARYGVVDEAALRSIKKEKGIVYCNDVYPEDAAGPKPVADIADIMLPHLGASTIEANLTAARRAAEQLIAYFEQGISTWVVNKGIPDDLDEQYQALAFCIARIARNYLGNATIRRVECSFYGSLGKYAKWFFSPIVAGISPDFNAMMMPEEAEAFLKEKGISIEIRPVDEKKKYGNSMTIDLLAGEGHTLEAVSVRGTITEGMMMISRINAFERLYFDPKGHSLIAVYRDRPGVLAKITSALAAAEINIEDIHAPHDIQGVNSMAVLKVNRPVPPEIVACLSQELGVETAFSCTIG